MNTNRHVGQFDLPSDSSNMNTNQETKRATDDLCDAKYSSEAGTKNMTCPVPTS
jgi:hypothetical protein